MLDTKSVLITLLVSFLVFSVNCEVIGLQNSNSPKSFDAQGIYYQHFSRFYGDSSFKANILGLEDHADMLNTLESLRSTNVQGTKAFLGGKYPSVLQQIQAANLWNAIPATQLSYHVLSKLHQITEAQKALLPSISNASLDNVLKSFDNLLQLKKLMGNLARQLSLENELRQNAGLSILQASEQNIQNIIQKLFQKEPQIQSKLSQEFINQFHLYTTPKPLSFKTQLQNIFGVDFIAQYLINFPEKQAQINAFTDMRSQMTEWYHNYGDQIKTSDLKLSLESHFALGHDDTEIFPFNDIINPNKVFEHELVKLKRDNITITEAETFHKTFSPALQLSYNLRFLLETGAQIYRSVRTFFRTMKIKEQGYIAALAYRNEKKPLQGIIYEGNCSAEPDLYEIKVSDNLYYGNKKISWDQLKQYSEKLSLEYETYWKVQDLFMEDRKDEFWTRNTFFPKEKQNEYKEVLQFSGITHEEFKKICKTHNEISNAKFFRHEGQVFYNCAHTILLLEESHRTSILFV